MIDIVDIRKVANDNKIEFYIKDNIIYCRDTQNGECVRVTFDKRDDDFIRNAKTMNEAELYKLYGDYPY